MSSIIIKNGIIVNFDNQFVADILIENKRITKIDKNISNNNAKIVDATEKFVIPGGIDPHVHMFLPTPAGYSCDDFLSGSKAALAGGTTSIIDFVTPHKGQSLVQAYLQRVEEAKKSLIDVKFHVSPVEWANNTAYEMEQLVEQYGVKSFKIYLAYKNSIGVNDEVIIKVLENAKKLNVLVTAHCENDEIISYLKNKYISKGKTAPKYHALSRPVEAEQEAVQKMILYAKYIDTPIYIVHVSSKKSMECIEKAQKEGVNILAETCPHYLVLDDSVYHGDFENTAKYVLSPPIRKKEDSEKLWKSIINGSIQTIGTDHCPFNTIGQKDIGKNDFTKIPNGAGGVEHRLQLLYTYGVRTGLIDMQKFVEITSTNAAKIFGFDFKSQIKEGFDADIVVWNPNYSQTISAKTHIQNCDSNIYEGFNVYGKVDFVSF